MAKFCGYVGYVEAEETSPGVWMESVSERLYYGDTTRVNRRLEANSDSTIDNFTVSNMVSIVADAYAMENFCYIRYVEWGGAFWKVSNVEVQPPRLILSLGGVYNGPLAARTSDNPGESSGE